MSRPLTMITLSAVLAMSVAGAAMADRAPTADELTQLETKLSELGYTGWQGVERDDSGYWEIDRAVHANGQVHELKLDLRTLEVIEREVED